MQKVRRQMRNIWYSSPFKVISTCGVLLALCAGLYIAFRYYPIAEALVVFGVVVAIVFGVLHHIFPNVGNIH